MSTVLQDIGVADQKFRTDSALLIVPARGLIRKLRLGALMAVLGSPFVPALSAYSLTYDVLTTAAWNGSCGRDSYPLLVGPLTSGANTVTAYFELDGVQNADAVSADWLGPDSKSYQGVSWASASGGRCYAASFSIANSDGAAHPGTWLGRGFVNGAQIFSLQFTIAAVNISTQYEGFLDGVDCTHIFGWARDRVHTENSLSVDIRVDNSRVGTVLANDARKDLTDQGIGNHAFNDYSLPPNLFDGREHVVQVFVAGTSFELSASSRHITQTCQSVPITGARSVFLIHGIDQSSNDLADFARTLQDPQIGLPSSMFNIDYGFDYSACASDSNCPSNCTIEEGARRLATYIDGKAPSGDIILIGYSMGGLIARDLILNRRSIHRVSALVTLGTPNLGYPYERVDKFARCKWLASEMYGDFRNPASHAPNLSPAVVDLTDSKGNRVAVSSYLYDLNTRWSGSNIQQPDIWLAASGTFCNNPKRNTSIEYVRGCRDGSRNDGVVCEESARFLWGMNNGPTDRWADPNNSYAHTDTWKSDFLFCGNILGDHPTLYDPPGHDQGGVVQSIRSVLLSGGVTPQGGLTLTSSLSPVPRDSDGKWYYTIQVQETKGVAVTLNKLFIDNVDYSQYISAWFKTSQLAPYGKLSVGMVSSGYSPPYNLIWEVDGLDTNQNNIGVSIILPLAP